MTYQGDYKLGLEYIGEVRSIAQASVIEAESKGDYWGAVVDRKVAATAGELLLQIIKDSKEVGNENSRRVDK